MGGVINELPAARGVVFDLRSSRPLSQEEEGMLPFIFEAAGIASHLTSTPVKTPGQRSRIHSGFTPAFGTTSGGYFSAFETVDGQRISPNTDAKDVSAVFLVNSNTELPLSALGFQAAGKAAILCEGAANDVSVVSKQTLQLSEIRVQIRLGELLMRITPVAFIWTRPFRLPPVREKRTQH